MTRTYAIWNSRLRRLEGHIYVSKMEAAMHCEKYQSVIEVIRHPAKELLKKKDIIPGYKENAKEF